MIRNIFSSRMFLFACLLMVNVMAPTAQAATNWVGIYGRVIDASTSAPISGVHVYYGSYYSGITEGRYVTTDSQGKFSITTPSSGLYYYVIAAKYGYGRKERDVWTNHTEVVFKLQKNGSSDLGELAGYPVFNWDTGKEIAGAKIYYRLSEGGTTSVLTTNQYGGFGPVNVPVGEYKLRIEAAGYESKSTFLVVMSGGTINANYGIKQIGRVPGGAITGKVVDRNTSAPLAGARVCVQGTDSRDQINTETLTNAQGLYRFDDIPAAEVTVFGFKDFYLSAQTRRTVTAGSTLTANLRLTPLAVKTGSISGVLKAAYTNAPMPGVKVYYYNSATPPTQPYVTTDAQGNFMISNVPAGGMTLAASATGYPLQTTNVSVSAGGTANVTFVMYRAGYYGSISAQVMNAVTKVGIKGAKISFQIPGISQTIILTTDLRGYAGIEKVPVGTYQVKAEAAGFVTKIQPVTVGANSGTFPSILLQPIGEKVGTLTGKAVDANTSAPLSNVKVSIHTEINYIRYTTETLTNSAGVYIFKRLPSAFYQMTAVKDGYYVSMGGAWVPIDATATRNFRMRPQPPHGKVTGTVKNAFDSKPLEGAVVRLSAVNSTAFDTTKPPDYSREVLTDSTGKYEFDFVPVGNYQIYAAKHYFYQQTKPAEVKLDMTTEANFQLQPWPVISYGKLTGRVVDPVTSTPLPMAWVGVVLQVTDQLAPISTRHSVRADGLGYYKFENIPVGTWTVYGAKRGCLPANKTVQIVKGQTSKADFSLQKITNAGAIQGTVTDAANGALLPGVQVTVPLIDLPHMTNSDTAVVASTGMTGRFVMRGVPAGTQKVTAWEYKYIPVTQTANVTAGTTSTLNFALDKRTTDTTQDVTVNVVNSLGTRLPNAQIGVAVCDLVEPFGDLDLFQAKSSGTGTATLNGIPVGSFFVTASLPGYQPAFVKLPTAPGSNTITLMLNALPGRNAANNWAAYR